MSMAPHDRLSYQSCTACGAPQTLLRMACTRCGSAALRWRQSAGRGVVHALTVVARAPDDAFRALVPYTLVIVTLTEGARVMGHAEPGLAIGDAVVAGRLQHGGQDLLLFSRAT